LNEQSPLIHANLYHTGIVVDDLASAQEQLAKLLGVTWLTGGGEVRIRSHDGVRVATTAYAISAEGPHHVELVQSVPGTLYAVAGSGRAHHLGYWSDDVPATSAALSRCGLPEVASIGFGDDDVAPICAYHQAGEGFYIELVSTAMRRVLFRGMS
jgi:Glyoxalase/Bleomycin resistance protein/Dioxygenase superfamily